MNIWRDKFADGAEALSAMGGVINWHSRLGVWGYFSSWKQENQQQDRYWNAFGSSESNFRQSIIVEVNPSGAGLGGNSNAVIARSTDGSRWVFHKGRLHISRKRITEAEFDAVKKTSRIPIQFSNGGRIGYHLITGLDLPAKVVQQNVADFVAQCRFVRSYYFNGPKIAAEDKKIEDAEGSVPEPTDPYEVGAQPAKVVTPQHGKVWEALVAELDRYEIRHSNARVGRWGPDLRTFGQNPLLFEIKMTDSAHDLQRAVGQLLLYERLLKKAHRKVLVMPVAPSGKYGRAVQDLNLSFLTYSKMAKSIKFDSEVLSNLVAQA